LLSYTGAFRVDDEHILAARAQSLALRGRYEEPQVYGNSRARQLAPMGDQATQVEPLQTVLGAALYRLGRSAGLGGAQALLTLNLYLTALTGSLVFLTVVVLGFDRRVGIWCGLFFGLATMAWPYASTFLRDSLAMAFAAVAFLGWALLLKAERRWRLVGLAAVAVGLAGGVLSKNTIWAVVLSLAIGIALRWTEHRSRRRGPIVALVLLGAVVLFILFVLPATGPLARFSADYYLFLLSHFRASLTPMLIAGVAGPFVSPAKSILLFSPPLVLAVAGAFLGWKSDRPFIVPAWLSALFLALAQALFYRDQWAGTFGWGLRFMLPALPPLVVVGAWAVQHLMAGGTFRRAILWAIAIAGVFIQLAGSWVTWNRVYARWSSQGLDPFDISSAWDAGLLAIPPQLAMLGDPSTWSAAWFRVWGQGETAALLVPVTGLALLALLAWRLSKELGHPGPRASGWAAALLLVVVVLPIWPALRIYEDDPAFGGDQAIYQQVVARLQEEVQPGDTVIVDPYASLLWGAMINTWSSPAPWYALPIELPGASPAEVVAEPAPEVVALFRRLLDSSTTVWYAAVGEVPPGSRESKLRWLEEHGMFVGDIVLEGVSPAIVVRGYRDN
jgi:hypothetical protein